MPWIIEEMKIKATKMRFVWLTPGKIIVNQFCCIFLLEDLVDLPQPA